MNVTWRHLRRSSSVNQEIQFDTMYSMGHGRSFVALQKLRPALFIIVSFIRKRIRHFEFFVLDSNINNKRCLSFDLFDEIRPAYACESSCIAYRVHEPKKWEEKKRNETKDEKINLFRLCSFLIWSFAVATECSEHCRMCLPFPHLSFSIFWEIGSFHRVYCFANTSSSWRTLRLFPACDFQFNRRTTTASAMTTMMGDVDKSHKTAKHNVFVYTWIKIKRFFGWMPQFGLLEPM